MFVALIETLLASKIANCVLKVEHDLARREVEASALYVLVQRVTEKSKRVRFPFDHFKKYKSNERDAKTNYMDVLHSDHFLFLCCPAPKREILRRIVWLKMRIEDGWLGDKLSKTAKGFEVAPFATLPVSWLGVRGHWSGIN